MITATEIKQKAHRLYADYLRSIVQDESIFPKSFSVGKLPDDYVGLRNEVLDLLQQSKAELGYGYTVELTPRKMRRHGEQSLPSKISIETERDYLKLVNKEKEVTVFQANRALIQLRMPILEDWMSQYPLKVVEYGDRWDDLLKVCEYFQVHQAQHHQAQNQSRLYIRELPIAVHTKFIESHLSILRSLLDVILPPTQLQSVELESDHLFEKRFSLRYNEPLIRLRVLDPSLQIQYHFPVSDFSAPISELNQLDLNQHPFIITENLMNFLTLPRLNHSFAIFGGGFGVSNLRSLSWLSNCPIFYWGDLDVYGFRILAQLRSIFPQVVSIMMDRATLQAFENFVVQLEVKVEAAETGVLSQLTLEEQCCFSYVAEHRLRLEQERISQDFSEQQIKKAYAACFESLQ
jgi:hypothetical protein